MVLCRIYFPLVLLFLLLKKHGDNTDVNNYRGITLSPSISKLFEKCLLVKFGELLVSPQQFGFQKKLSCSHAIYSMRSYDTRCYFNVRSKADIGLSQLNLPHGTDD